MSSKQKKYTVAIIGAGRISASFDAPKSKNILTHAHAIQKNPRLALLGFVDQDAVRGTREAKRWRAKCFPSIEALYKIEKPDIVVVATPDHTHVRILARLSKLKPKLIICEKPVVAHMGDIAIMQKLRLPPTIVNYSRRFDPTVAKLAADIANGKWGSIIAVRGIYTGSLLHNGSHLVDLARCLVGDKIKLELTQGDVRAYSVFEIDILMSRGRVRFVNGGRQLLIERPKPDPMYRGFKTLGTARSIQTNIQDALPNLYRHALAVLDGTTRPHPSIAEALATEKKVL
ncbi:MAG: Gfo/Idh/MocA family oxidoreductase [bacterium]|nr:Gfo/Idh/MocA family oxidoreductase [bacterium]